MLPLYLGGGIRKKSYKEGVSEKRLKTITVQNLFIPCEN